MRIFSLEPLDTFFLVQLGLGFNFSWQQIEWKPADNDPGWTWGNCWNAYGEKTKPRILGTLMRPSQKFKSTNHFLEMERGY